MIDVKYYHSFRSVYHDTIVLWLPRVSEEFLFNTLQSKNVGVKSVGTKVDFWENCTLKSFLKRWIKHFNKPGSWGEGAFAGCILEECNCCCFVKCYRSCRKYYFLWGKWISPVIQTALFTRDYNYRFVYSLLTKYRSYLLKLISIFGHFLTVNNRRYGRSRYVKKVPPCSFHEFYTHLETNSARSFQNAFYKCSRALNIVFKNIVFLMNVVNFQPIELP